VIVLLAGSNDGVAFPAARDVRGVVGVRSFDYDGTMKEEMQTKDETMKIVAPGASIATNAVQKDGTYAFEGTWGNSLATPITAGMLAVVSSKYPEASNAQLLQSRVRKARSHGGAPMSFVPDRVGGFGEVDLPARLAEDPTRYPDVNPFSGEPTVAVTEAPSSSVAAAPSATATVAPTRTGPASPPVLKASPGATVSESLRASRLSRGAGVAVAGGVFAVIGVAVSVGVMSLRKKQRTGRIGS
jgi:hypothetical protein